MIFHESDVETGFAPELNVGAREEVEGGLLETALWDVFSGIGDCGGKAHFWARRRGGVLLG